jgi:cytochrome c oxidase assembly protein subunit 15
MTTDDQAPATSPLVGPALTFGFAGAIAMTSVGYILRLPGDLVPAPLIAGVLLLIHAGACLLAGRARGVGGGALAGFVLAAVNLLVLGSLRDDFFRGEQPPIGTVAAFVAGWLAFGAVSGAVFGYFGAKTGSCGRDTSGRAWAFRLAVVTGVGAFLLLIKGGLVTSAEEGLAVPDWPATFGSNMFLYPLSRMTGGVFLEHAHRLFGALIGLTTVALWLYTVAIERAAVKAGQSPRHRAVAVGGFATLCFVWVCGQGVLGGIRVTEVATGLAMVHGVTGQMFVAMLFALAAFLAPRWSEGVRRGTKPDNLLRSLAQLAAGALLIQIGFGAAVRHFDLQLFALFGHILWSFAVTGLIVAAGFRAYGLHHESHLLRELGRANLGPVVVQMALGLVALIVVIQDDTADGPNTWNLVFATAHQAVGAILFVASVLLAVWTQRIVPAGRYPHAHHGHHAHRRGHAGSGHSGSPPDMS